MDELKQITDRYNPDYVREGLVSLDSLKRFSLVFFKDVAEIYDFLTHLKNVERNPSGFSLEDAPILGLLVRIAKLLKEVLAYYEKDNAEIIGILERPMLEASAIATYLMRHGPDVMLDYRKCSPALLLRADSARSIRNSFPTPMFFRLRNSFWSNLMMAQRPPKQGLADPGQCRQPRMKRS
jgi:hypothetical protein